ncbi:hypothetical protein EG327_002205 [Venturia inaequalis]|uniref:Protein BTN n=1 Tax=Venturia inaequalis TaxID=5025 RepID=A0A8H3ZDZ9_VENIN|nr:hypothetical protein EG327_002205 [Venturia inaequalis]
MEKRPSSSQAVTDGVPIVETELESTGHDQGSLKDGWRAWFQKDVISFFFLGLIIAFPTMLVSTGANAMFPGVTGAFGVSLSCTAAVTAFTTPLFLHHINLHLRVVISLTASVLGMIVCTLGRGSTGPVIGTCLAGFVYAFSTNAYLAIAAFYDPKTVRAFSSGSGFAVVFGPGVYIALMRGLNKDWRKTYLVCLPFLLVQVMIWWLLLSKEGRRAAERSRQETKSKQFQRDAESVSVEPSQETAGAPEASGFGPGKTRLGLFLKTILPVYVLPLVACTLLGIFALFGLAPIFQEKATFKNAPEGNLSYEISFLLYGSAQFLFSMLSTIRTITMVTTSEITAELREITRNHRMSQIGSEITAGAVNVL